ncbi:MAG: YicC family protein [Bacteroidetes bacterium]|nr:YicC family protein [Bacteroidota bacterium]
MLQSMTGFGKAKNHFNDKTITVEIRTLNSKGIDASLRMPNLYREKEIELRNELTKSLDRGKIDVLVQVEYHSEQPATQINTALAQSYYAQLKELANSIKQPDTYLLEQIMRMPDVMKTANRTLTEEEYKHIFETLKEAIKNTITFRRTEGQALLSEFEKRIALILGYVEAIETIDPLRIERIKTRIHKNLSELITLENIDKNRLEQELIYYIEKIDITEEKTRLRTHLTHFLDTTKETASGRKLNFISQEMGREINTIGSKANDAAIQKMVVLMKDELEKIKEQSLNVL